MVVQDNVVGFSVDGYASVVVDPAGRRLDASERLGALNVVLPSLRDGETDLYCVPARWQCARYGFWRDVIDVVVRASAGNDHDRDNNYDNDRSWPCCQPARLRLHPRMVSNSRP